MRGELGLEAPQTRLSVQLVKKRYRGLGTSGRLLEVLQDAKQPGKPRKVPKHLPSKLSDVLIEECGKEMWKGQVSQEVLPTVFFKSTLQIWEAPMIFLPFLHAYQSDGGFPKQRSHEPFARCGCTIGLKFVSLHKYLRT